ncbi:Hypothetical_protein [Hexamita inflata]|uniref:Hypothetical_protein n=1 Tax=Hexamita inflata TaxID=28002 RepID=A0AA86TCB1_9EUKA|nr:Hypothetical protein HINF_LOCUS2399 [Hexamita inflata]
MDSLPIIVISTLWQPKRELQSTHTENQIMFNTMLTNIVEAMYPLSLLQFKLLPLNLQALILNVIEVCLIIFVNPEECILLILNYMNDYQTAIISRGSIIKPETQNPDAINIKLHISTLTSHTMQINAPVNTLN